jgi:hypothetical protein
VARNMSQNMSQFMIAASEVRPRIPGVPHFPSVSRLKVTCLPDVPARTTAVRYAELCRFEAQDEPCKKVRPSFMTGVTARGLPRAELPSCPVGAQPSRSVVALRIQRAGSLLSDAVSVAV